ncbi:DUF1343 domain-containing protein [Telmatocola sphagniphila]|uniref:DUF1343 domain-containing protein n=1 Tax=Telmatocola sphagniphila TaxID=1123043 RepID=A0A8E6B4Z9_9BACT|nr:exo-beta-N-acetylmuramidase NamZ domain-containing protein [Telmatocola sphagniphila]QVL30500.1 DUF1343 domain-containing protein [Telmatocola sphagniphila]
MKRLLLILLLIITPPASAQSTAPLEKIRTTVEAAIARGELPGAVVLVNRNSKTLYFQAIGQRAIAPKPEAMTPDTIFDLASLTKPIATAACIWKLVEEGKLKVTDRVSQYWPEFTGAGKEKITIDQLLLHTSGLMADNALSDYQSGKESAFKKICKLPVEAEPGVRFKYSDVGYIVLGHLVERVSGTSLNDFATKNIFAPLGLKDTRYLPEAEKKNRIAPTGKRDGQILRGVVHDPRAHALEGVAGHAGLFAPAEDLLRYAQMLLQEGELKGLRIFKPETVKQMLEPAAIPGGFRSRGWDVDTAYTAQAGTLFNRRKGFGHTGFTGTSLWVDRETKTIILILTNRVHPDDKGNVTPLRRAIANLVAEDIGLSAPEENVATGIDVLQAAKFDLLQGKRIGLVTNQTGVDRLGNSTIDILHQAPGVKLIALFSPEHGIRGALDQANIGDTIDEKTKLPIYSLYAGKRRKPTADMLKDIDLVVYDIQDIGCRFYTYVSTLGNVLEAAHENGKGVVVLDRPNPIGGVLVQGPVRDASRDSFVAYHTLPVRHGMTIGELAQILNEERGWRVPLQIVKLKNSKRGDTFDRTGLRWVNPSPNMRSLTAALLYPGIGLLETTNLSVGRGTDRPFEWVGAPYIDGKRLAAELKKARLPGVSFVPTNLTPSSSKFEKEICGGVSILITDWETFDPLKTGFAFMLSLRKLYPEAWSIKNLDTLLVHKTTIEAIQKGTDLDSMMKAYEPELKTFLDRRKRFLLYP